MSSKCIHFFFLNFQIIQSVLMTIANNFVTDKNSGEVMTVGWVQNLIKTVELYLCAEEKKKYTPFAAYCCHSSLLLKTNLILRYSPNLSLFNHKLLQKACYRQSRIWVNIGESLTVCQDYCIQARLEYFLNYFFISVVLVQQWV